MHYSDTRIEPYLPSLQPTWVKPFSEPLERYRKNIPFGSFRSLDEFNWFDGEQPRFWHRSALYSPGHAELNLDRARVVDAMLFNRDRDNTFLLVDSGGYQVGTREWPLETLAKRLPTVIAWQEAIADLAVILEVPAWTKKENGKGHIPFDYALERTNENLREYARRASGDVKFLIPVHGMDFPQACTWFEETKWFVEKGFAVGWCFSSKMSSDLSLALHMLLYMISKGHYPEYLHFLGQGSPQAAIVCSIMRRVVPRSFRTKDGITKTLTVTMDASSEFQSAGRFGVIYERVAEQFGPTNKAAPYRIKQANFLSADRGTFPPDRHYPEVEGPVLGKEFNGTVYGDILAPEGNTSDYNLDPISHAILIAHNVWVKQNAIERLAKFESAMRRIDYGRDDPSTKDMADMLSRLIHGASEKGVPTDVGADLVASTRGIWKVFRPARESASADAAYAASLQALQEFESQASALFPKDGTVKDLP